MLLKAGANIERFFRSANYLQKNFLDILVSEPKPLNRSKITFSDTFRNALYLYIWSVKKKPHPLPYSEPFPNVFSISSLPIVKRH